MVKENIFCGIAFNYHDSSISFAEGNNINLVLEAERVFRKKKMRCSSDEMEKLIRIGLNEIGQANEILAKCLAHNICVLIQEMFELICVLIQEMFELRIPIDFNKCAKIPIAHN